MSSSSSSGSSFFASAAGAAPPGAARRGRATAAATAAAHRHGLEGLTARRDHLVDGLPLELADELVKDLVVDLTAGGGQDLLQVLRRRRVLDGDDRERVGGSVLERHCEGASSEP